LSLTLNTSKNAFIKAISFEILYEVKSRHSLLVLIAKSSIESADEQKFLQSRQKTRNDVANAVKLTQAKIILIYDRRHRSANLERKAYNKIIKAKISRYYLLTKSSLSVKKIESFKILEKIKSLIYKLELSIFMKIHSVIFIVHSK
jgi:predicted metal-dependent phosphoesterase TrpH